ncbi:MAG: hypothetical protein JWN45_3114 [Acidobacteriaceae bacterium]|nr:hypothetical protein [Acidobacteriaceae bacterium]
MSDANISLAYRWFEDVWNKGRTEVIDELFPSDGVMHGLGERGGDTRGPTDFKEFFKRMRGAFPDIQVQVEDVVATEDKVAVRFRVTGTHKGDDLGIEGTNRPIELTGISLARITNGKIQECWNSWDQLGMLQQIGAIAPPKQVRLVSEAA